MSKDISQKMKRLPMKSVITQFGRIIYDGENVTIEGFGYDLNSGGMVHDGTIDALEQARAAIDRAIHKFLVLRIQHEIYLDKMDTVKPRKNSGKKTQTKASRRGKAK